VKRIVITGGAGFVGGSIASYWREKHPEVEVVVFDSLRRRGSEITIKRLLDVGVKFVHGDVRCTDDLAQLQNFELMMECSAEPSVLAGYHSPQYMIGTNLQGTINCLELCRARKADMLFFSTSRVYPYTHLNNLKYKETNSRFEITDESVPGISNKGISEAFPLDGPRTLYGATKLASEIMIQEYIAQYNMRVVVNRCGVLCGPWQMGKTDQGFITFWLAQHLFGGKMSYIGYEGSGKQVRDILHVRDLCD
jgi:CDP-paratose 2-epimerase